MTKSEARAPLVAALDQWAQRGAVAEFWLRDDDAIAATETLAVFAQQLDRYDAAPLIAAIPARLEPTLADVISARSHWRVAPHGWMHIDHAQPPARASEHPDTRLDATAVVNEFCGGRQRCSAAFGAQMLDVYVPPWNRIGERAISHLASCGYRGLSTFAAAHTGTSAHGLLVRNCHVDIIKWRGGRSGRSLSEVAANCAEALASSQAIGGEPIGVLTHHLVHDAMATQVLDDLLEIVSEHPAARWITPDEVFRGIV